MRNPKLENGPPQLPLQQAAASAAAASGPGRRSPFGSRRCISDSGEADAEESDTRSIPGGDSRWLSEPRDPARQRLPRAPAAASAVRASGPLFPANVFSEAQAGDRIVVASVLAGEFTLQQQVAIPWTGSLAKVSMCHLMERARRSLKFISPGRNKTFVVTT